MATAQVLMKVGILIISFLFGILFFYFTSPAEKDVKKLQLEVTTSQIINFVIYIWVGKVIFHIKLFVQDPLAVLAYPSNAEAFYVATILFLGTISYQVFRKKINLSSFIASFVPIFLVTSFVYEFIQLVYNDDNTLIYLTLLTALLMIYMGIVKRITKFNQILLLGVWALGQLVITFTQPYATSFGYLLSRYFFLGIIVLCLALYFYNNRKKVA